MQVTSDYMMYRKRFESREKQEENKKETKVTNMRSPLTHYIYYLQFGYKYNRQIYKILSINKRSSRLDRK